MKVSRERMAENRGRILDEASRLFRAKGFEAVSVAEVMQAAGLTHGGFYGHFASKEELIAKTIERVLDVDRSAARDPAAFLDGYLSDAHRGDLAGGCPTAALASEVSRRDEASRAAMSKGVGAQIDRIARDLAAAGVAEPRRAAVSGWAAMVGAVILARACGAGELSDEILRETRAGLGEDFPAMARRGR